MRSRGLFFGIVLLAVALLGAGCRSDTPTPASSGSRSDATAPQAADGRSIAPEGWREYQGKTASLRYPPEWNARAAVIEDPEPPDLERVFFDPDPISTEAQETEPRSLVMFESWSDTVEAVLERYRPLLTQETRRIGSWEAIRFTYQDEFFGDTAVVGYVLGSSGRVYLLERFDGDDIHLEAMIAALEVEP